MSMKYDINITEIKVFLGSGWTTVELTQCLKMYGGWVVVAGHPSSDTLHKCYLAHVTFTLSKK